MSQRRLLVTGGAGFIGSHLVDRLLKEGFLVKKDGQIKIVSIARFIGVSCECECKGCRTGKHCGGFWCQRFD